MELSHISTPKYVPAWSIFKFRPKAEDSPGAFRHFDTKLSSRVELWLVGSDCRRWPGSRMASRVERTRISCPIDFLRGGKGVRVAWVGGPWCLYAIAGGVLVLCWSGRGVFSYWRGCAFCRLNNKKRPRPRPNNNKIMPPPIPTHRDEGNKSILAMKSYVRSS